MTARTLMVQGATSDAGKTTLVAGLCRVLARRGVRVAPFKPQNMALNSAVTEDGGEIGRAQAVQAQACYLPPHTDMNPVLLKPNSDTGAQVIVHGRALRNMEAGAYQNYKHVAMQAVRNSHARLSAQYDVVLVEGAGSPAEINLRTGDVANMGFAEAVDCPVLLIADIDRGGVFAHLVGTLALLSESEQARVKGFVINRFRGDIALLEPGLRWLEECTGKPVLGVLPYLQGFHLEAEDALPREAIKSAHAGALRVIVPALPRISNATDFDPLRLHPQIDFQFCGPGETPPPADLIILPGSKSVRADLEWLCAMGWDKTIQRHLRYGGKLIGICGGFQMLGHRIADPHGIEGPVGDCAGLDYFDMQTELAPDKQLHLVSGKLSLDEASVTGYEIHAGITKGAALAHPAIYLADRNDGARSHDDQIFGTYLHGLFESPAACDALLRWAGLAQPLTPDYAARRDTEISRLADMVETYLDMPTIANLLGIVIPAPHQSTGRK